MEQRYNYKRAPVTFLQSFQTYGSPFTRFTTNYRKHNMSCPANPAKPDENGSSSGPGEPGTPLPMWSKGGLLVFRTPRMMGTDHLTHLKRMLDPMAQAMGVTAIVCDAGSDARIEHDLSPLWSLLAEQIAAINRLAASNEALVQAMASPEPDAVEADPTRPVYLDRPAPRG